MSRVIHVQETEAKIESLCQKHALRISVIEPLVSGGLRVVMSSSDDTETLRGLVKGQLITGEVRRSGSFVARRSPPSTRWR